MGKTFKLLETFHKNSFLVHATIRRKNNPQCSAVSCQLMELFCNGTKQFAQFYVFQIGPAVMRKEKGIFIFVLGLLYYSN